MNYREIVQDVIMEHKNSPIDIFGIGAATGEYQYLSSLEESYIRTIRDIDNLWEKRSANRSILEIGSFLGIVSISLKKIGYNVNALDIPEFYQSPSLRSLYEKNDVPFTGLNLKKYELPYETNSFDAVIICEVMEHLNFNPLPVLKEINRILKKDGYIYIGMPNQSHIINRIKLLLGKSIHNPIDDFLKQLDKNRNMVVGIHWREYTLTESIQMIEEMGFQRTKSYYFAGERDTNIIMALIRTLLYIIPSFRPYQVLVGKKVHIATHNFWFTEASS